MDLGVPELLIILVIVALLFGPGRIANVGGELGKAIRAFRTGMSGEATVDSAKSPVPESNSTPSNVSAAPDEPQDGR